MNDINFDNLIIALRSKSAESTPADSFVRNLQKQLLSNSAQSTMQIKDNKLMVFVRYSFTGIIGLSLGVIFTLFAWQLHNQSLATPQLETLNIAADNAGGNEATSMIAPDMTSSKINPDYFQSQVGFEVSQPNISSDYQLLMSEPALFNQEGKASAVSWTFNSVANPEIVIKVMQSKSPIYQASQSQVELRPGVTAKYFNCNAIYAADYCNENKATISQQTLYWQDQDKIFTIEALGTLEKSQFIELAKTIN